MYSRVIKVSNGGINGRRTARAHVCSHGTETIGVARNQVQAVAAVRPEPAAGLRDSGCRAKY
jgi:hypothetical protein